MLPWVSETKQCVMCRIRRMCSREVVLHVAFVTVNAIVLVGIGRDVFSWLETLRLAVKVPKSAYYEKL